VEEGKHTVLRGFPCVGCGLTRRDRALCDTGNTIHLIRVKLTNAVEVKTCSVVLDLVVDSDLEGISPISYTMSALHP